MWQWGTAHTFNQLTRVKYLATSDVQPLNATELHSLGAGVLFGSQTSWGRWKICPKVPGAGTSLELLSPARPWSSFCGSSCGSSHCPPGAGSDPAAPPRQPSPCTAPLPADLLLLCPSSPPSTCQHHPAPTAGREAKSSPLPPH